MSYGHQGRLVALSGAQAASYRYDTTGKRAVVSSGGVTRWIVDEVYTAASEGSEEVSYRLGNQTVGTSAGTTTGDNTLTVYAAGQLGSLEAQVTSTGTVTRQAYTPFGTPRTATGANILAGDRSYTDQIDDNTGLMYYRARYYDPTLARFTQPDTIVPGTDNPQALNRYAYVFNNPVTLRDPDGRCPTDSAAATACYATQYAQSTELSANDQLIVGLWAAWGRINVAAQHYVGSFATQPDTFGYSLFYASADPNYTAKQTQNFAEAAFVGQVGADLAGLDAGNGIFLLPEDTFEGPSRQRPPGEIVGTSGWRPDLVDDRSPARHLLGWLVFGYVYPNSQVEAGLRAAEGDATSPAASQQDYDLGVLGYQVGSQLTALDYTVPDLISQLRALTSDGSQGEFTPTRIAPDVPGSGLLCYLGVTC